jgi:Chromo (CHRromatin Organisation MOdifier) domain
MSRGNNNIFYVEKVLDRRTNYRRYEYLIKWEGYGTEENTWEPRKNFLGSDAIKMYRALDVKLANSGKPFC